MKTLNQGYMNRSVAKDLRILAEHLEAGLSDIVEMEAQKTTKPYDPRIIALGEPQGEREYLGEHKVSFTLRYPGQG